jgi:hypothetical protein
MIYSSLHEDLSQVAKLAACISILLGLPYLRRSVQGAKVVCSSTSSHSGPTHRIRLASSERERVRYLERRIHVQTLAQVGSCSIEDIVVEMYI